MRLVDGDSLEKLIVARFFSKKKTKEISVREKKVVNDILDMLRDSPIYTFERITVPITYYVNWRSVEDELPPPRTSVLCYLLYESGQGAMAENQYYGNGKWLFASKNVAFWTELPDVPKEILESMVEDDEDDEDEDGDEYEDED